MNRQLTAGLHEKAGSSKAGESACVDESNNLSSVVGSVAELSTSLILGENTIPSTVGDIIVGVILLFFKGLLIAFIACSRRSNDSFSSPDSEFLGTSAIID